MTLLLLALACSGTKDTADTDTGEADADTDADTDTDTDADSDTDTDTDTDADTDTDTDTDTGAPDGSFEPDPSCDYVDNYWYVANCAGTWDEIYQIVSASADPSCPDWFSIGGDGWVSVEAALAGEECDTSCVYTPEIYYMFLYCDYRSEWLSHVDGGIGQTEPEGTCPEILYFETSAGSGYYPTQEEFEAANPCPE